MLRLLLDLRNSLVKREVIPEGEETNSFWLQSKEICVLGETSSRFILQSLGLRLFMYIYEPLNLKIKPSFF